MAVLTARFGDVDDIVQEVLVRAIERKDRIDVAPDVGRFLRGIARLVVHEHVRDRRRRSVRYVEFTADCIADDDAAFDFAADEQLLFHLRTAMARLPLVARRLLELRYHDGFSAAASGEMMSIRPTAVRVTLPRIRERLRSEICRTGIVR